MERMPKEEISKLKVGDVIHPNSKYREIYNVDGKETDFFIEEKDVLFIRDVLTDSFVVELLEDIRSKRYGFGPRYGLFLIPHSMISPNRWYGDFMEDSWKN